jgi:putative IMPACT (imprinted ancient) family translation regulator
VLPTFAGRCWRAASQLEVLRHQQLEGVLATVVRYFGGVKLGAGGLVRAYTDAVAQALLGSHKVVLQRMVPLACRVPYAMEGWVRRQLQDAGAALAEVRHGEAVEIAFAVTEDALAGLRAKLDDGGQGQLTWLP